MRSLILGLIATLAFTAAADAKGARTPSPRAFVNWIYSHYPLPEGARFDAFGASARQVFDPPLVALLREDERLADGEIGFIDADLFCQCQDDGGMRWVIDDAAVTGPRTAISHVTVRFPGDAENSAPIHITLSLVLVGGQWRVHDLGTRDAPSLRADLAKANAEARSGRR